MAAEESKGGLSLMIDIPTETAVKLEVRALPWLTARRATPAHECRGAAVARMTG